MMLYNNKPTKIQNLDFDFREGKINLTQSLILTSINSNCNFDYLSHFGKKSKQKTYRIRLLVKSQQSNQFYQITEVKQRGHSSVAT